MKRGFILLATLATTSIIMVAASCANLSEASVCTYLADKVCAKATSCGGTNTNCVTEISDACSAEVDGGANGMMGVSSSGFGTTVNNDNFTSCADVVEAAACGTRISTLACDPFVEVAIEQGVGKRLPGQ